MKPEELAERLKAVSGLPLVSVVLYGSAVAGDHAGRRSDYNVLVVLERLGAAELDALAPAVRAWTRAGNRPPLLFTRERLAGSADVFPIELMDIQDHHIVLHGTDAVSRVEVPAGTLRLELERELKVNLMRLREGYLAVGGRPRPVARLMVESVSTFGVLARAALRLFEERVPAGKRAALEALTAHLRFDAAPLLRVLDAKDGRASIPSPEVPALFDRYLASVESLADAVDRHLHDGLAPGT